MAVALKRELVLQRAGWFTHQPVQKPVGMKSEGAPEGGDNRQNTDGEAEAAARPPRPGPKRKLPKMNPSERAKYYRRRVREYMAELEATDSKLAREVDGLHIIHLIQQRLAGGTTVSCRQQLLAHVWEFLGTQQYLSQHVLSDPSLKIHEVQVSGEPDGVVIRLDTAICGCYSQEMIEKQLYPCIPGNTRLLDKLLHCKLSYSSSIRFYFAPDGALVEQTVETDFAAGLLEATACSPQELRQLLRALGDPGADHRIPDRDAQTPSLDFLGGGEAMPR